MASGGNLAMVQGASPKGLRSLKVGHLAPPPGPQRAVSRKWPFCLAISPPLPDTKDVD